MFAVVEIAGTQFEVTNSEIIRVPLISGEPGTSLEFNNILVAGEGADVKIGAPYIKGSVSAKILAHGKDQKVIVFKKKRRKGYQKRNGHRQKFTKIEITNISIN
jgi:large subunit ribosomal protein L21